MRIGYNSDNLTSADIQKIVETGEKVNEFYKADIYRENFKLSPFRKVIEKFYAKRKIYKDKKNDLMQRLVELVMNSLYGVQKRKDINNSYFVNQNNGLKQSMMKMS